MRNNWWCGRFRGHGYRVTVAREAILDVLGSSDKHLSAEDIYFTVHKKYPAIGLTTVYRTLDILVQMGFVYKFDFGDGRARFELMEDSKGKRHHHHLVCNGCGRVIDYTDFIDDEIELLQLTEKGLSKKYNFDIKGHIIQFHGLCNKCKGKR
ncbi:MAG: transcriptional repressor [Elusimicrobia bacterium]|nr:transcriptional repressor [Elusimicrobiota bacterium]